MLKKALTAFILPFLFLLSSSDAGSANPVAQMQKIPDNPNETTGILQKMIAETGTATMKLDLNRLNGISVAPQKQEEMRFDIAANSFFSILVFNDLLRGPEQGSMALIPQDSSPAGLNNVPAALGASFKQLTIEKLPSGEQFDLAVRDAKTGFVFFNIEGHQVQLRRRGAIAYRQRRKARDVARFCQRSWAVFRRRGCGGRNLYRRGHAAGGNQGAC